MTKKAKGRDLSMLSKRKRREEVAPLSARDSRCVGRGPSKRERRAERRGLGGEGSPRQCEFVHGSIPPEMTHPASVREDWKVDGQPSSGGRKLTFVQAGGVRLRRTLAICVGPGSRSQGRTDGGGGRLAPTLLHLGPPG